jgi:hypothetical protein
MCGKWVVKIMDITSGLLDTINGKIPAFPQEFNQNRIVEGRPGYVWKKAMFPQLEFHEDYPVVKGGILPIPRRITRLI